MTYFDYENTHDIQHRFAITSDYGVNKAISMYDYNEHQLPEMQLKSLHFE